MGSRCFLFSLELILVFFITLERSALLLFFFFQRIIVTQRKLSVARVVPFLLPFSFLEQTRFRFLEQRTKKREREREREREAFDLF